MPISGLPTLKLRAPPAESARPEVAIALLSADGAVLTEARSVLAMMPAGHDLNARCTADEAQQTTLLGCEPNFEPAPAWVWPGAKREAKSIMRWGDEALSRGSIGAARSTYEYAAGSLRWPAAALVLAMTYDPHELAHIAPLVTPDREKARFWYLKARELTNARINFYLQRLPQPKALGAAPP